MILRGESKRYGSDGWFRVTIGTKEENRLFVDLIREFFGMKKVKVTSLRKAIPTFSRLPVGNHPTRNDMEETMSQIKAVFFDQDGVIIDTERDGHRVSFNMAFKEFGFSDEWSEDYYHELLQIAGGKERMKHHWKTKGFSRPLTEVEIDDLVKEMHKRKTALIRGTDRDGQTPPASGGAPVHERGNGCGPEDRRMYHVQ